MAKIAVFGSGAEHGTRGRGRSPTRGERGNYLGTRHTLGYHISPRWSRGWELKARVFGQIWRLTPPPSENTLFRPTQENGRIDKRRFQGPRRGCEHVLTEIRLKKGEPVEKALRRLKKKIDREGTLKVVRNHRHFEKPSERKRRKMKAARFSAMLTARYADM